MEGTTEEAMAGENSTEQTTTKEVMAVQISTEKTMSGQNQTAKAVQNTTEGSLKNVTASTNVTNTTQAVEDVGPSSILYPGKCIQSFPGNALSASTLPLTSKVLWRSTE